MIDFEFYSSEISKKGPWKNMKILIFSKNSYFKNQKMFTKKYFIFNLHTYAAQIS